MAANQDQTKGGLFGASKEDKRQAKEERAMTHGSGGAAADTAVEGKPSLEERHFDGAHSRPAEPLPEGQTHDHLAEKKAMVGDDTEALIDESVEESFPASDPPSASKFT